MNSEDAAFVKSLDVLVDAGLVDREALDAEMAEIRASVSQFDSDLLEKLHNGEEDVTCKTSTGKKITVPKKTDPALLYMWKLVEAIMEEESKKVRACLY